MSSWTDERREARLNQGYFVQDELTETQYNLALGGVVLYGLLFNVVICLFAGDVFTWMNPLLFIIAYVICCIAGVRISSKSDNPLISFFGYNLVVVPVGLVVSSVVSGYGGVNSDVVFQAFAYTAIITFIMIGLASVVPNFFSKLGGILFAVLLGMIICEIIMLILGVNQIIFAWIGAVLFSLYIGYDFWKAQQYPKTMDNAVDSALDIYLDIINLFLNLLRILGNGNRRGRN